MDRPQVDRIDGIPPAIAIDRKDPVRTSRSTVGTMTEITDYVKLIYARLGRLHCRSCGRPVEPETPEHVWHRVQNLPEGSPVVITFPYPLNGTGIEELHGALMPLGFDRFYRDGRIMPIEEWLPEEGEKEIAVVADRFVFRPGEKKRVLDSVELAFRFGSGRLEVWMPPDGHHAFSSRLECAFCHIAYSPRCRTFSRSTAPSAPATPAAGSAAPSASTWT